MSKIYISSDLHLNHNKDFIYKPRGFQTVDEMNVAIIQRFREVIQPDDHLYLLGDIMLGGADAGMQLFDRLPRCYLHIIRGNHDTDRRVLLYNNSPRLYEWVKMADQIKVGKWNFTLSHYPMLVGGHENWKERKIINLSGHTHSKDKFAMIDSGVYNVAVDAHNCSPVDLETIISDIKAYQ